MERIGQQFGNYRLTRLLGEGSFAEVYLGEQIYLDTQAAIKILRMQLASNDLDQFRTEARTVARLNHPNIVRVLDFGVQDGTPYLVLEYAANGTLRQRVARGRRLPLAVVAAYMKQAAAGLQYAHEQRLIHRDVKPENMLLGGNGEVLLSDFGLALMAQSTRNQSLQDIAGTIPYIAPEQIQGRPIPASDQYALGIVAYEWLSGRRPFDGSVSEIIAQHLSVPPRPLREQLLDIDPAVDQVLAKALEKDAALRYPTIRDFALALEQVALANPSTPGVAMPSFMSSPVASVQRTPVPPINATPAPAVQQRLIVSYREHGAVVRSLCWSPDGQQIVSAGDEKKVYVWEPRGGTTITSYQEASDTVRVVALSPTGLRTATAGSDALARVWDRSTNKLVTVYQGHVGKALNALNWLPDVQQQVIATGGADGTVQVWDSSTGQLFATYRGHKGIVNALAWSPDGLSIASGGTDSVIHVWSPRSEQAMVYAGRAGNILTVAWSPDGRRVGVGRESGLLQWWEPASNSEVLVYMAVAPVTALTWSPGGERFAFADGEKNVQVWSAVSNQRLYILPHGALVRALAWSPDGTRIASGGDDKVVNVWSAE